MRQLRNRLPVRTALAALLLAAALSPQVVYSQANLLDGKAFVVSEGDAGKPANIEANVLTFSDGTFHSKECDQWGYGKGEVKAFREGDAIRFEAETRSEKYGTRQVWAGTVKANAIDGKKIVYGKPSFFRPNPEPREGWFKGALQSR